MGDNLLCTDMHIGHIADLQICANQTLLLILRRVLQAKCRMNDGATRKTMRWLERQGYKKFIVNRCFFEQDKHAAVIVL